MNVCPPHAAQSSPAIPSFSTRIPSMAYQFPPKIDGGSEQFTEIAHRKDAGTLEIFLNIFHALGSFFFKDIEKTGW